MNGNTFSGSAIFTKTGASNDGSTGNNTFNGPMSITNSGTGYMLLSNSVKDIYNTDANFAATSGGIIYVAYNGSQYSI